MTLEDTPKIPTPELEKGDKVCTVDPSKIWEIIPDELALGNLHMKGQSFFVQLIPGDPLSKPPKKGKVIIWLIPLSRRDELAPPEE